MKNLFILLSFLIISLPARSELGFEIITRLIDQNNFTVQITLNIYGQTGGRLVEFLGELDFGDGNIMRVKQSPDSLIQLKDEFYISVYTFQHTYPGPGRYKITYLQFNRYIGLNNFPNSSTSPVIIENLLVLDPLAGVNELPLSNEPSQIFSPVQAGLPFEIDLSMVDPDSDSLSYSLVPCSPDPNNNYTSMPGITIDENTGILSWEYPQVPGFYAVCTKTEEYKQVNNQWIKLSHHIRDWTLQVTDEDGMVTAIDGKETENYLYPNPAGDWLRLPIDSVFEVKIFDLSGKLLEKQQGPEISLSGLNPGMYLLQYEQRVIKFIKQ